MEHVQKGRLTPAFFVASSNRVGCRMGAGLADLLVAIGYCIAFVAMAQAIVLGSYFLARTLLHAGTEGDRTHDAAGAIAVRIATLLSLILALVYAQELDDYKTVRTQLTEEAVAINDVYNDIVRYGGPDVAFVQTTLARYVDTVIHDEWERLGEAQTLSPVAWSLWDMTYRRLLDLVPANPRESFLANRMLQRITAVSSYRQTREASSTKGYDELFWVPALIGLSLIAIPFYVYRPTRTHLLLLSFFGLYAGIILFFIYAFADPFRSPGRLDPEPFERLLQGEMGAKLPSSLRPT